VSAFTASGVDFGNTRKWRDARRSPRVTFLLDDVLPAFLRARDVGQG
jgi:hypothetical protein